MYLPSKIYSFESNSILVTVILFHISKDNYINYLICILKEAHLGTIRVTNLDLLMPTPTTTNESVYNKFVNASTIQEKFQAQGNVHLN